MSEFRKGALSVKQSAISAIAISAAARPQDEPEFPFDTTGIPEKELPALAKDLVIGGEAIRQLLGFRSRRAVYALISSNRFFPAFRISGGRIAVLESQVREWFRNQVIYGTASGKPSGNATGTNPARSKGDDL